MPRDSSGNYTLPPGNPVVGGTTVTTAWANPTMTDIGAELTNSLDRSGRGGMLAPFKFADGTVGAPGITWNAEPTSGIFRAAGNDMQAVIAGVPRMRWTASSVDVWDTGTSTWLPIVGPSGSTYALVGSPNIFTAINTFNTTTIFKGSGSASGTSAISLQSILPVIYFVDTDAAVDRKKMRIYNSAGGAVWDWQNDAESVTRAAFNITLNGGVTAIAFGNSTDNTTFTFNGTGLATFGGAATITGILQVNGDHIKLANTDVYFEWNETDVAADEKIWWGRASSSQWSLSTRTDAGAVGQDAFRVARTGVAVTQVIFGNATSNPTFTFLGTGIITLGGAVSLNAPLNIASARPGLNFNETDQALDEKRWRLDIQSKTYSWQTTDDAISVARDFISVARGTGIAISGIAFGNATDNPNYNFNGTGPVFAAGPFLGPAGAVGTPSHSFSGDTNTGMFSLGADWLGFAAGGSVTRFSVSAALVTNQYAINITGALATGRLSSDGANNRIQTIASYYDDSVIEVAVGVTAGFQTGVVFGARSTTNNSGEGANFFIRGVSAFKIDNAAITSTKVILAPAGALAGPGHAFSADVDTGLFLASAGQMQLVAGGVAQAEALGTPFTAVNRLRALTVLSVQDGTAANPSLAFDSDIDTGFYHLGTDAIGAAEGGVGFRIGYRNVPRSSTTTTAAIGDVGKCIPITATIAIPVSTFAAGDALSIYNDSAGALTVTCTTPTLRLAGTTTAGTTRTLAARGMMTLWFNTGGSSPDVICSGPGVS